MRPLPKTGNTIRCFLFLFSAEKGLEDPMRMSGGHALAAGLDGGNTLRCARTGRNGNESLSP